MRTSIPAFKWIGSLSYTGYVLHFPLQLSFALLVVYGIGPTNFGYNPLAFLFFFAVLIPLAHFSYIYLEEPLQKLWRRVFLPEKKSAQAASVPA